MGLDFVKWEYQVGLKKQKGVCYWYDCGKWVVEFNFLGKKNNKIFLGEYDNFFEVVCVVDVGMFCYGFKWGFYNFDDSFCFL